MGLPESLEALACCMAHAGENEVTAYLQMHASQRDAQGHRLQPSSGSDCLQARPAFWVGLLTFSKSLPVWV